MDEPGDVSYPKSNTAESKHGIRDEELSSGHLRLKGNQYECSGGELKARLQELLITNASLLEKLECSENENQRLRSENEELVGQQLVLIGKLEERGSASQVAHVGSKQVTGDLEAIDRRDAPAGGDFDTANWLLALFKDAPLHISCCDANLRYVWVNHSYKSFCSKDVIGKLDEEIFSIETEGLQELIALKQRALQNGQTQIAEVTLDLPNDSRMTWMVTTRPHVNNRGAIVGVSTLCFDITEQVKIRESFSKLHVDMTECKPTEDELRQAVHVTEEALQAKNVILAIMSHELRTPLNGLLGLAEALDSSDLNDEQRELVSGMLSSGVIIADILDDILDLASMEFGALEFEERPFNPADIVQDILKMAKAATHEKDVAVISEVASEVPEMVIGDAVRIRQIMKYLVLNAVKFTEKGSVQIRLGAQDAAMPLLENSTDIQKSIRSEIGSNSISQCQVKLQETSAIETSAEEKLDNLGQLVVPQDSRVLTIFDEDASSSQERGLQLQRFTEIVKGGTEIEDRAGVRFLKGLQDAGAEDNLKNQTNVLLYCEIVDTGVGIPKEAFPTLFNKFTQVSEGLTRNYGGTGLGLAICKQLVELMGGQLAVTSEVGKGSTFTFTVLCKYAETLKNVRSCERCHRFSPNCNDMKMPMSCDPVLSSTKNEAKKVKSPSLLAPQPKSKCPRILLAEDNKVNVMVAISMLKRLGFTAKVVANGVEALEAIRKEEYDLVLLDICMPLMDGLQVAYAIRKYEETGEWPQGDLRKFFKGPSSSSLPEENKASPSTTRAEICEFSSSIEEEQQQDWRNPSKHRLPIVAVTANALRSDVDTYFAHGMDAFIAKPVMFQNLREILERYLPTGTTSVNSNSNTEDEEAAGGSN